MWRASARPLNVQGSPACAINLSATRRSCGLSCSFTEISVIRKLRMGKFVFRSLAPSRVEPGAREWSSDRIARSFTKPRPNFVGDLPREPRFHELLCLPFDRHRDALGLKCLEQV